MTPDQATACIIYCRASTREQAEDGDSFLRQETLCRAEAERRGWQILRVATETVSGDRATRPVFEAAVKECHERGAVLLVDEASRLTRRKGGVLPLFEQAAKQGWAVVALDFPEIDVTSPMGEFVATLLGAVSRLERRVMGARVSGTLRAKVARGDPVGRPRAMPQATLDQIAKLRAEGLSMRAVAEALNGAGITGSQGGQWSKQTVQQAIKRYGLDAAELQRRADAARDEWQEQQDNED